MDFAGSQNKSYFTGTMLKNLDKIYKYLSHPSIFYKNYNVVQIKLLIVNILYHNFISIYDSYLYFQKNNLKQLKN